MMVRLREAAVTALLVFAMSSLLGQGKAPNFKAQNSSGGVIELDKLKGRVVVLNYWATWCGPCRQEIPGFLEVYKTYRSKGLEIIGVALDDQGWFVVNPFVAKNGINYPVVLPDEVLRSAYGSIEAIPTTFIVDKKGNIADKHIGYMDKATFERKIKALL